MARINFSGVNSPKTNHLKTIFNMKFASPIMNLCTVLQSQRDCALQPRVASSELPWENRPSEYPTLKGLRPRRIVVPRSPHAGAGKAAEDSRTLGRSRESLARVTSARFWSAAVLCRFGRNRSQAAHSSNLNIRNLGLLAILCLFAVSSAQAKLNVVATTPDLASIAKDIGGDHIDLTTLAKPTEDPHFVDAKPSFILKLNRTDVLIEGGAELEIGWLPALLDQSRNQKIASGAPGHVACAQGVSLLEIPSTLDRSHGDIHAAGNPHYVVDPVNARKVAQHIADAFCQRDPKSCDAYHANLKKWTDTLDAKIAEWQKAMAPFKGREVVAYHNSWLYFAKRFDLNIDLFLEPKPGVPPTPTHLAEVITKMRQDKVGVILVDPYLNRRTAEAVAEKTSATVVDVTQFPGGVKGTEGGYIPMMDYLVGSVAKALSQSPK
jgi:zinc/manganese transport system substrate-binding protein